MFWTVRSLEVTVTLRAKFIHHGVSGYWSDLGLGVGSPPFNSKCPLRTARFPSSRVTYGVAILRRYRLRTLTPALKTTRIGCVNCSSAARECESHRLRWWR